MDPVVVVAVVAGSVVLVAQLVAVVAHLLGDDTAARAGRLWRVHERVDLLGTILVPATVAMLGPTSLLGFGWARPAPVRPAGRTGWREVVTQLSGPAAHLVLAVIGIAVSSAVGRGATVGLREYAMTVTYTNLAVALFLLLPLPMLPGGLVVRSALRGERATRWDAWSRRSRSPAGVVMAGVVAWLATDVGRAALLGG